jgi:hypothetical protein
MQTMTMKEQEQVEITASPEELPKLEAQMRAQGWDLVKWTEEEVNGAAESERHLVITFEREASPSGDTPPADLTADVVAGIPTLVGQLVRISELVNTPNVPSDDRVTSALNDLHLALFREWISNPLEQRKADLDRYLSESGPFRRTAIQMWLDEASNLKLIPKAADEAERLLFQCDFEALVMPWAMPRDLK